MKKLYILIIYFLISAISVSGNILTLQDAIYTALNKNIDINNSIKSYKQNKLEQIKTLSMYIPNIGLNYTKSSINEPNVSQSFSSYPIDNTSFNPFISFLLPGGGNVKLEYKSDYSESNPKIMPGFTASPVSYTKKFTISFSQPLLQNLLLVPYDINIIRMAKYSKNIARLAILQASDNIAFNTAIAYINIFINKLNLKVRRSSLNRAEILLNKNIKKQKLGLVETTDILSSRASLKKRYSDLIASKNSITELKENLKLLMGTNYSFNTATNIEFKNIAGTSNFNIDKEISTALKNRIDLKILEEQKQIQKLSLLNIKSKLFPKLNLIGSYSYYGNASDEDTAYETMTSGENKSWTIGIQLLYPLYPQSPISELKKAKLELEKLNNTIKKKKLEIANNIKQRINDIKLNEKRLLLLEETIKFQREKLLQEEKKFKIGRSSTQLILRYQDDIEAAETEYLSIKFRYYISLLSLEYNKGTFLKTYYKDYYDKITKLD